MSLSLPRRWIGDLLALAQKVPVVAGEGTLRLSALAEARRRQRPAPSWSALLLKGYGLAAQRVPDLRRSYMPFPWPRFYESPHSVASVVINRPWRGEHATFMAPLDKPEELPLTAIQDRLRRLQNDPLENHGAFRRLIRTARIPWPFRSLFWKAAFHLSGSFRARYFGTFGINSIAAFRGRMLQFVTPLTSVLYYDRVTAEGNMTVQIAFDHRVFDGYTVARALNELEAILNNELLREVKEECVKRAA